MYTTKFIRLHSKCLVILEMIKDAGNRIEGYKADMRLYGDEPFFSSIYNHFSERIETTQAIKQRLTRYYAKTFTELTENVVKECYGELEV